LPIQSAVGEQSRTVARDSTNVEAGLHARHLLQELKPKVVTSSL
jgi:hypothetical protein